MRGTAEPDAPKYPIDSVDNALRLLLLLRERPSLAVNQAAQELGVAPSTAHRVLAMLNHHGFVEQDRRTRTYQPGPTLIEIGLAALRRFDIRSAVRPTLERLVADLDETAHVVALTGNRVIFLDVVESSKILRAASRVGHSLPAHATASGKAILAALSDDEVKAIYPASRLEQVTARTHATRRAVLEELAEIRERGYAVNIGESEDGLIAIAAAICDETGVPRGAFTVAAPETRLQPSAVGDVGAVVGAAATSAAANLR
jgi:DNA-binding IclR family transcriptional regulator